MKKVIIKTALITLACLLGVVLLLAAALTMFAPRTLSSVFGNMGSDKVSLWYMELSYQKFGETDDLIDVFAKAVDAGDDARVEKYGRELSEREDFLQICAKEDGEGAGVGNAYNDYVCGNTAVSMFKNGAGAEETLEYAVAHTAKDYPRDNAIQRLIYTEGASADGELLVGLMNALAAFGENNEDVAEDIAYLKGLLQV